MHRFAGAGLAAALTFAGCGTPGAPQPPSLNLPEPVADLAASRAGNQVALTWTMPKRNTDKLLLKGNIAVHLCRKEATGACEPTGTELAFAPGADGAFTDTLPANLTAGTPRPLRYFVELRNRKGRSAGLSNAAVIPAGAAPPPVANLTAKVRKQGVVLLWSPADESSPTAVRLHRKLLTPPASKPQQGLLAPQPEPLEQNLLVNHCAQEGRDGKCRTLDQSIRFGQSYEYRAQRVARVVVDGNTTELAGELSAPLRVDVQDIFPPEAPIGLAAVATTGEVAAIDLSWQPVSDTDLASYIVYRREDDASWQRISPAEPLVAPAFLDAQVQPGHSYSYAVSAIGQNGLESPHSTEAGETVPNP
ncbi:MAG: fibronectin type III domain-containing protein [Terracidiphilus sp.]